jgi:hypothetical protein
MKYRRHPYGKITSSCEKFKTRAQVSSDIDIEELVSVLLAFYRPIDVPK